MYVQCETKQHKKWIKNAIKNEDSKMFPLSNLKFFHMCDYSANIHKHFQSNQIK